MLHVAHHPFIVNESFLYFCVYCVIYFIFIIHRLTFLIAHYLILLHFIFLSLAFHAQRFIQLKQKKQKKKNKKRNKEQNKAQRSIYPSHTWLRSLPSVVHIRCLQLPILLVLHLDNLDRPSSNSYLLHHINLTGLTLDLTSY